MRTERNIILLLNDMEGGIMNVEKGGISPTLRRETHGHEPILVLTEDTEDNDDHIRDSGQHNRAEGTERR